MGRFSLRRTGIAVAMVTALAGPVVAAEPAFATDTTTVVSTACDNAPGTRSFTVDSTLPATVRRGHTVTVRVAAHLDEFFGIPAPYSGTITNTLRFAIEGGTPADPSVTLPPTAFQEGEVVTEPAIVEFPVTVTAAPGSMLTVRFSHYDYSILPNGGTSTFVNNCAVTGTPVIASARVVKTPSDAHDCKHGGWKHLTDDRGRPFRNQGQCICFVRSHHHRHH